MNSDPPPVTVQTERVFSYKYLGVCVDDASSWSAHRRLTITEPVTVFSRSMDSFSVLAVTLNTYKGRFFFLKSVKSRIAFPVLPLSCFFMSSWQSILPGGGFGRHTCYCLDKRVFLFFPFLHRISEYMDLTPAEVVGQTCYHFIHVEDLENLRQSHEDCESQHVQKYPKVILE